MGGWCLVDVGAFDQEGDAHVCAVLVEVLSPDPGADDVDGADVPERALRLLQRLHRRVVAGRLRASNQLDDLDNRHSLLLSIGRVDGTLLVTAGVLSGPGAPGKQRRARDALLERSALPATLRDGLWGQRLSVVGERLRD